VERARYTLLGAHVHCMGLYLYLYQLYQLQKDHNKSEAATSQFRQTANYYCKFMEIIHANLSYVHTFRPKPI
jgi:hypothetical protein